MCAVTGFSRALEKGIFAYYLTIFDYKKADSAVFGGNSRISTTEESKICLFRAFTDAVERANEVHSRPN